MTNYTTTGDGSGQLESLGNQFQNFMLQLAEMKARQQAQQDAHNYRQAELDQRGQEMEMRAPLIGAQTEHFGSETKLNFARQAALDALQESGQNAGLGAFGQAMVGTEGYDPNQTSFLVNTPENQSRLMEAIIAQHLTQNAASSPAGAEGLMKPVEVNRGANLVNPRTGRTLATGQAFPKGSSARAVSPGGKLFDAETGEEIASNPKPPISFDNLGDMVSLFRGGTDSMSRLSEPDKISGEPLYKGDPTLGSAFTNSANIVQLLAPLILKQLQGTNAPSTTTGTNAEPASAEAAKVGDIYKGYRRLPGKYNDKSSWEKVK